MKFLFLVMALFIPTIPTQAMCDRAEGVRDLVIGPPKLLTFNRDRIDVGPFDDGVFEIPEAGERWISGQKKRLNDGIYIGLFDEKKTMWIASREADPTKPVFEGVGTHRSILRKIAKEKGEVIDLSVKKPQFYAGFEFGVANQKVVFFTNKCGSAHPDSNDLYWAVKTAKRRGLPIQSNTALIDYSRPEIAKKSKFYFEERKPGSSAGSGHEATFHTIKNRYEILKNPELRKEFEMMERIAGKIEDRYPSPNPGLMDTKNFLSAKKLILANSKSPIDFTLEELGDAHALFNSMTSMYERSFYFRLFVERVSKPKRRFFLEHFLQLEGFMSK